MKQPFVLFLALTLAFTACSKKVKKDESSLPTAVDAELNLQGDSDAGQSLGLQTIHFAYDTYTLDAAAKKILVANAAILKDKTTVKIQVEGHCDARGGIQYNIALGEKRANSVKKFLVDQGAKAENISIISFGSEKPIDPATTEEAYAKNRRANFVVTAH